MNILRKLLLAVCAAGALATSAAADPSAVMGILKNPGSSARAIVVAHRGVFMKDGVYIAENTIEAIERGYNAYGYRAFEIDLKILGDGTVVVQHDLSAGRTTDYDGHNGHWTPLNDDLVVNSLSGATIRNATGSTPWLGTINSYQYDAGVNYHKVYGYGASMIGTQDNTGQVGYRDHLSYFLSHSYLYPDAVLVLDIQSYDVLTAAMRTVQYYNAWNRVIFKVWSQAFPAHAGTNGRWYPDTPINNGTFVISVNPTNASAQNMTSCCVYVDVYDPDLGRLVALSYRDREPSYFNQVLSWGNIIGVETFINGLSSTTTLDNWLSNHVTFYDSNRRALGSWGVVRGPDAILNGSTATAGLPWGNYSLGTDVMNLVPTSLSTTRNNYGNWHDIVIKDIQ